MSGKIAKLIRSASRKLEAGDNRHLKRLWSRTPAPKRFALRAKLRPGHVPDAILPCHAEVIREDMRCRCRFTRNHQGKHRTADKYGVGHEF